ncbi:MAG: DUF503 family protein [Candidatus Dadabacteria bacterium]|nr:DUF503 family protein [Candidatus Dadabacteria bacterium]
MVVGVLNVELLIDGSRSLKDKRTVVKSITHKVRNKFKNISISEVDSNDLWQKAALGACIITNDAPFANSILDQVLDFIQTISDCRIYKNKIEILHL